MKEKFGSTYLYEIKRGGTNPNDLEVISNEEMGVYLMSFDLEEPWNKHRKYQVFEDAYNNPFARPEEDASRLVFIQLINQTLSEKMSDIENELISRYALMYITKGILFNDETGKALIQNPKQFIQTEEKRKIIKEALSVIIDDIIIDLNAEVSDLADDFDYKSNLRNDE